MIEPSPKELNENNLGRKNLGEESSLLEYPYPSKNKNQQKTSGIFIGLT
jgi:hypothetical protein